MRVSVDMQGAHRKLQSALSGGQEVLDSEVIKASNQYVPMDQGYLRDSALQNSQIGSGVIVWSTPYAARLYYNPHYNFSGDSNPNAQGLWFEAARAANFNHWLSILKSHVGRQM
ncbi:minor capsid protein [Salsuginibacillus halophilus]|uniref:Minor capsid protein n=1 Tax=Salsuginibacillus halophilus TaxID=517424 RepID=A0A2P8H662_9BACI|nr:minor capsid protein [Salsuginibacillus halophilus]PSL41706.1 minor capsid protein [Salsuginibacillus halophilus]